MKFVLLTKEEYTKFWNDHPLKSFLSSPEIGDLRKNNGWKIDYTGIKNESNDILAAAMLVSIQRRFGGREYYAPRGYLIDFHDKNLVDFFTEELKKYVKANKGYVFRMDPYLNLKERDIDGNIVENGFDNSDVVEHLKKLGFKQKPISELEQVGWMFSLDLKGKDEAQILKGMKQNTRNTIRKASKIGITIRELSMGELQDFHNIMIETGARKNFAIRELSYYENMYQLLHDKNEVKFLIAELNLDEYLTILENTKAQRQEEYNKLGPAKYNDGKKKAIVEEIHSIEKKMDDAKSIQKETGKSIISLSSSMFIMMQPEIIYLSSGNYDKYMHFNGQYLIQWYMIQYGIQNHFAKYNFYGIPANINTHPENYGIYEFKRGFNGYVEELIGEFEIPLGFPYYLMKFISSIKRK